MLKVCNVPPANTPAQQRFLCCITRFARFARDDAAHSSPATLERVCSRACARVCVCVCAAYWCHKPAPPLPTGDGD
ncbi:hypothetical protein EON67_11065, partial [archaeon]